jgi:hypothetical protein
VAIIASEIKEGAPFIFTNYNRAAPYRVELGKRFEVQISATRLTKFKHIEDYDPIARPSHLYSKCELHML